MSTPYRVDSETAIPFRLAPKLVFMDGDQLQCITVTGMLAYSYFNIDIAKHFLQTSNDSLSRINDQHVSTQRCQYFDDSCRIVCNWIIDTARYDELAETYPSFVEQFGDESFEYRLMLLEAHHELSLEAETTVQSVTTLSLIHI